MSEQVSEWARERIGFVPPMWLLTLTGLWAVWTAYVWYHYFAGTPVFGG